MRWTHGKWQGAANSSPAGGLEKQTLIDPIGTPLPRSSGQTASRQKLLCELRPVKDICPDTVCPSGPSRKPLRQVKSEHEQDAEGTLTRLQGAGRIE